MKSYHRLILAASAAAAFAAVGTPAGATGAMKCDSGPQSGWKSMKSLEDKLTKEGWQVRKAKIDGGCYEVYATDADGNRVEAYFHPVSFEKLLVSRRGEVLFRKQ